MNGGKWSKAGDPENLIKRRTHSLITLTHPKGDVGFRMCSWITQNDPGLCLMQFIGDDTLHVDMPHRNNQGK